MGLRLTSNGTVDSLAKVVFGRNLSAVRAPLSLWCSRNTLFSAISTQTVNHMNTKRAASVSIQHYDSFLDTTHEYCLQGLIVRRHNAPTHYETVAPSEEAQPTLGPWAGFEPVRLETSRTPKHSWFHCTTAFPLYKASPSIALATDGFPRLDPQQNWIGIVTRGSPVPRASTPTSTSNSFLQEGLQAPPQPPSLVQEHWYP
ncbi:hypothetical protein E2C01_030837 [Portunus trituberculatus]|uniref:Uncharacterized protein n=1 Tax=Portunus trituberculatus TaxID=210409 RepID=A0A5B7EWX3_PORTR|nr:hypothetical protein [Portunus trituberculatus]